LGSFIFAARFGCFRRLVVTLIIAYALVILGLLDGNISWTGVLAQLLYFANYYGLFFDPGNTTAVAQEFSGPSPSKSTST